MPGHAEANFIPELADAVRVTDFGAIDDLKDGYYYVTWTDDTDTLTSACTFQGNVTVANTGPNGVAQLTLPDPSGANSNQGLGYLDEWVGKPIAITGAGAAGGTLVAVVTGFAYSLPGYDPVDGKAVPTWTLGIAAPTPLADSTQRLACPCFCSGDDGTGCPSDQGKHLWITDAASPHAGVSLVYGNYPLIDTIASVNSPFSVTLATAKFNVGPPASRIVKMRCFTDNACAVANAFNAAAGWVASSSSPAPSAMRRRNPLFSGWQKPHSTGKFGIIGNPPVPVTQAQFNLATAMADCDWWTSGKDTETVVVSDGGNDGPVLWVGNAFWRQAVPVDANVMAPLPDECGGATGFRCCAALTDVPFAFVEDSWGGENPSGSGNNSVGIILRRLARQNKNRNIRAINRSIAGTRWRDLADAGDLQSGILWNTGAASWISQAFHVPDPFGSGTSIVPAGCLIALGDNDGGYLHPNDVWGALRQIRAITAYNGLAPDIWLMTEGPKSVELWGNVALDQFMCGEEYAAGYVRSVARTNGFPLLDVAAAIHEGQFGWSPDRCLLRPVPPLPRGTASATEPYRFPRAYQTRNFRVVLLLGATNTTSGAAFWRSIDTLEVSLSGKPDNRAVITAAPGITGDASGTLHVYWRAWGGTVETPAAIGHGSTALITSGQTALGPASGPLTPNPPTWAFDANYVFDTSPAGQCYLATGCGFKGQDFRTILLGWLGGASVIGCDANDRDSVNPPALFVGGWMFKPQDAQANANIRIADRAGNMLRTTISAYSTFQSVTLAAPWPASALSGTPVAMEVGRFSAPTYHAQPYLAGGTIRVPGAATTPLAQMLVVEKSGTRLRVGIIMGETDSFTDFRHAQQEGEQCIFDGEAECFGGPFVPRIWATGGTATVTPVWVAIDDAPRSRDLTRPRLTSRELMGTGDANYAYPDSGDTSHPSRRALREAFEFALATQNLSLGPVPTTLQQAVKGITSSRAFCILPANALLKTVHIEETAGRAVTGGINIGVSPGGSQVAAALAIGANAMVTLTGRGRIPMAGSQAFYISAASDWNNASLNVYMEYEQ